MAFLENAGTDHIKQLFRGHQLTEEQIKVRGLDFCQHAHLEV